MKRKWDYLNHLYYILPIGVTLIWLLSWFFISKSYPELNERANFGESFGMISSLFSVLALVGVIIAILIQNRELKQQNNANNSLEFRDVFFKMIENYHVNVNLITSKKTVNEEEKKYKGVEVFKDHSDYYISIFNGIYIGKVDNCFEHIKRDKDGVYTSSFDEIKFIFEYVEKYPLFLDENFYKNIFNHQIFKYVKFIIALYYIHDDKETENYKIIKNLVEKHGIIKRNEFDNFLTIPEKRKEFMDSILGEEEIKKDEEGET